MGKIKINSEYSYYTIKQEYIWNYDHIRFKVCFYKKIPIKFFNKTLFTRKKLVAIRFFDDIKSIKKACLADIRDLNNMHKNDQPKYVGVMTCKVPD